MLLLRWFDQLAREMSSEEVPVSVIECTIPSYLLLIKCIVPPTAGRHPWETAANLVHNIDIAFEKLIKSFQIGKQAQHHAEGFVILKYRFQSWAYGAGLYSMLGARQPLHERLYGTSCTIICKLLDQILLSLDTENIVRSTDDFTSGTRALSASLQQIFQQLVRLFPENDGDIMKHAFFSRTLESDDDDIENPAFPEFPDLEVIAAMKRIKILSEQADSKRSLRDQLMIQMKRFTFDKTKSSVRSTGVLEAQQDRAEPSHQVIVEWKNYEGFWDTHIGNELFHRVEFLTEFLRTAARGSEILDLRLLDCLGYCHDDKRRRLGFVYAIPKSVGTQRYYLRLTRS
jgi:hypothetical protein